MEAANTVLATIQEHCNLLQGTIQSLETGITEKKSQIDKLTDEIKSATAELAEVKTQHLKAAESLVAAETARAHIASLSMQKEKDAKDGDVRASNARATPRVNADPPTPVSGTEESWATVPPVVPLKRKLDSERMKHEDDVNTPKGKKTRSKTLDKNKAKSKDTTVKGLKSASAKAKKAAQSVSMSPVHASSSDTLLGPYSSRSIPRQKTKREESVESDATMPSLSQLYDNL